ncbi:hypothetical protein GGI07_000494 [Coemansia sp. Benny D115]|nr:hypothetical protein GGI07_000494 [Coemansia sp. Benny D115]
MADNLDKDELRKVCKAIVCKGDLDTLTDRSVRRSAEKSLGLEEKSLDAQPYKKMVKDIVIEVLELIESEKKNDASADGTDHESGNEEQQSDADKDVDEAKEEEDKKEEVDEEEEEVDEDEDEDEEEEFSDVMDVDATNASTKRSAPEPKAPVKSKKARTTPTKASTDKSSSSSNVTITNLKNYINKCGVRKVWAKELAGMNGAQQVRHLKKMLEDLGMEGRPTLEKCKQIKAKRELQQELEAISGNTIIENGSGQSADSARRRRSTAKANVTYVLDESSESEESEEEAGDSGSDVDDKANNREDEGDQEDQEDEDEVVEESEESDAYTEGDSDDDMDEAADKDEASLSESGDDDGEDGNSDSNSED